MSNLQQLCHQKITESILLSPPTIQEMIINHTIQDIKNTIKDDVKDEVKNECIYDMTLELPSIISEIIKELLESRTNTDKEIPNFYLMFSYINKNIIDCSLEIANQTLYYLDKYYYCNRIIRYTDVNSDDEGDYMVNYYGSTDHENTDTDSDLQDNTINYYYNY